MASTASKLMRAVQVPKPGTAADALRVVSIPIPRPTSSQVLVKVRAFGVNRPDVLQRKGLYPAPKGTTETLGLEISGDIVETTGNSKFKIGDPIAALTPGGGYAEYCVVDEGCVLPLPGTKTSSEKSNMYSKDKYVLGAASPEAFFTVWKNLFSAIPRCNSSLSLASDSLSSLKSQTILVHGGSSGIGSTAIMLANHFGMKVITTVGNDDKANFCESVLNTDLVLRHDVANPDWETGVKEFTNGKGVNVVLDYIGGDYLQKNINVLGTYGSVLRSQSVDLKTLIRDEILLHSPWETFQPIVPVSQVFQGLESIVEAHELMESNKHMGKIVVCI